MNQEALVDAIGSHLEAIDTLLTGSALLVTLAIWAGWRPDEPLKLLDLELEGPHRWWGLMGVYSATTAAITVHFLRLDALLRALAGPPLLAVAADPAAPISADALASAAAESPAAEGAAVVMTSSSLFNPLGSFGTHGFTPWLVAPGWMLLLILWWLGLASATRLYPKPAGPLARPMVWLLCALGVGAALAIYSCSQAILEPLGRVGGEALAEWNATRPWRIGFTALGIVAGIFGYRWLVSYEPPKARTRRRTRPPTSSAPAR